MIPFITVQSLGMALAIWFGAVQGPGASEMAASQLGADTVGSTAVEADQGAQAEGGAISPDRTDEAGSAPILPPPEDWVARTFGGLTFKTPASPVDTLEGEDFKEFVLWESGGSDQYIIMGAGFTAQPYEELATELMNDNFKVDDFGIVEVGGSRFHDVVVTDPVALESYMERIYYAAEPDAAGMYLEVYGAARVETAESYEPAFQALMESVAAASSTPDDGATAAPAADPATYSFGGVAIVVPSDWVVRVRTDDELTVGPPGDDAEGLSAMILLTEDTFADFVADAEADGYQVEDQGTHPVGDQTFRVFKADLSRGEARGHIMGLASVMPNSRGQHVAVMATALGQSAEAGTEALDMILASTRLTAAADFVSAPSGQGDAPSGAAEDDAAEMLLAHVVFDGEAVDTVSGAASDTLNVVPTEGRDGAPEMAMSFNGDGWVRIDQDINPAVMPQVTLAAWVKPHDGAPIQTIVSHDNGGFDRSLVIDRRGDGVGWSVFTGNGVLGALPLTPGEWTFVAGVWDQTAGTVRLHVDDAILQAEQVTTGDGHAFVHIGHNPSYGEGLRGSIQEVWVFDGALSTEDLQALRERGPTRAGPVESAGDPDPADLAAAALARGQALQAEGDYVGALKAYRESLLLDPKDDLLGRVEALERYLEVKGIEVPRQD